MALQRAVAKCVRRGAGVGNAKPARLVVVVLGYHMKNALGCVCGWPD